jgi:N-acetylglucosaminyldiphosphoundecaprenol N-acetyl-beta-D-mannosaminyltransferase
MRFGRIEFSDIDRDSLLAKIFDERSGGPVIVVTPNIQHLHLIRRLRRFEMAVNAADYVIPDGWPISCSLRMLYGDRRGRLAGSDFAMDVVKEAESRGASVAIIGGADSTLNAAYRVLERRFERLRLIRPLENPKLPELPTIDSLELLSECFGGERPDVLLFCFGAPKSELHAIEGRNLLTGIGSVLCVGATVDFIAGTKVRAPGIVQRLGLEWLFRLIQEPRRLAGRYAQGVGALMCAWSDALFRTDGGH